MYIFKGVTVPDEFTGEEVFATQLNEDDYPGLKPESKSKKGITQLLLVFFYDIFLLFRAGNH